MSRDAAQNGEKLMEIQSRRVTEEETDNINQVIDDIRESLVKNIFKEDKATNERAAMAIAALAKSISNMIAMNVHMQLPNPYLPIHKDKAFDMVEFSINHIVKELRSASHAVLNEVLKQDAEDTKKQKSNR